jgi:GDP/UDP-N,N'-diacetylbacillosamine 2-epimerase (hydrolysing)
MVDDRARGIAVARKIFYVTGTRADFGLMASTLGQIARHPGLELQIAVTGMHLSETYGLTVRDIEAEGLPIVARILTDVEERSPASMSRGIGEAVIGLTDALAHARPDFLMVIGDRGEMLAGAIAALHLGVPIVHLHGGERSGTVDEPVRHAITKLSHWHFVATQQSRERVVRMGEREDRVWITGAPSLDDLERHGALSRAEVLRSLGLPAHSRFVLVLFHPVVQEMSDAARQTQALAQALREVLGDSQTHLVWLAPNADAGSAAILDALDQTDSERLHRVTHLPRPQYIATLRHAEALVGNSSSGIIEAASFGTPVVNVGNRQRSRERNRNTVDCASDRAAIAAALAQSLAHGRYPASNVYGDGKSGARITQLLATLPIEPDLLDKVNTY